jgi:UDP-N-acetylglucosamine:LPS N-acetylglucosamine transferase
MDLTVLGKGAILVPTPGQTEQEYLAKIMLEKKWFYTVSQAKFNLDTAVLSIKDYFPGKIPENSTLLKEKIKSLSLISQNNKANNIRIIL